MIRIAMIVAAGVALAGCQTGPAAWQKPGASAAQVEQAFKECDYDAERATPGSQMRDPIASGVSDGLRVVRLRDQCMAVKGYSRKG